MYRMGGKIRALDELARQEFIFFSSKNNPKLYHCGWFMSWQFRVAARYIRWGYLYYAVKKQNARLLADGNHRLGCIQLVDGV